MPQAENGAVEDVALADTAPAGRYDIDVNHSSVIWRIKHLGLAWYTARFTRFEGALEFDPDNIEAMTVRAEVDLASVRAEYTGTDKDWDDELRGDTFLGVTIAPKASFTSSSVTRTGDNTAVVAGNLAFRGITKPFALDVTYNGAMSDHRAGMPFVGFSARGVLKRSAFGVVFMVSPRMPDEVEIIIEAELAKSGTADGKS